MCDKDLIMQTNIGHTKLLCFHLVLLSPTPRAMREMLKICDNYAKEFNVAFNAKKSKCLIVSSHQSNRKFSCPVPHFYVGGNVIEIVNKWPHLGHIITDRLSDDIDVDSRRNSLIGQINNVLCYFHNLDSVTKTKLLKSYCSSFYGCELWDFWDGGVDKFSKAWRQGQRSVWKLPFDTHRRFLPLICNSIPIEDEICRRFLNFIHSCIISGNELIKFVVRHGLLYGGMFSLCGRNAVFCADRYCIFINDILQLNFNCNIVKEHCKEEISTEDLNSVLFLMELTFIRDGIYSLNEFNKENVNDIISLISSG